MFGCLFVQALLTTTAADGPPTMIIPSPAEDESVVGLVSDVDGVPIVHVEIGYSLATFTAPLGAVLCLEADGEGAACLTEVPSPTGVSAAHRGYLTAVGITYSLSSTARSEQQTVRLTLRDGSAAGRVLLSSPPRRFRVQPMALVLRPEAALGIQGISGSDGSGALHRFTLSVQGLHFPQNKIFALPVAALSVSLRLHLPGTAWAELARLSLGRDVLELELGTIEAVCARAASAAAVAAAAGRRDSGSAVLGEVALRLQAVAVHFASRVALESIAAANTTLRCPGGPSLPHAGAAAIDDARKLPTVFVRAGTGLWARTLRDSTDTSHVVQLYAAAALLQQLPGGCDGGGGADESNGYAEAPSLEVCSAVPTLASHAQCVPLSKLLPPGHCNSAASQQAMAAAGELSRTKLLPLNVDVGSGVAVSYVFVWLRDAKAPAAVPEQFARLRSYSLLRSEGRAAAASAAGVAVGDSANCGCGAADAACQAATASGQDGSSSTGGGGGGSNGSPLTAAREQAALDVYERMFEQGALWGKMTWMGVQFEQNPNDAIVLQEILYAVRPDLIIETGSHNGGSALYFASVLRNFVPDFHIVSLDMTELTDHLAVRFPWVADKVTFLKGDSTTEAMRARVSAIVAARGAKRVVVSLDSEHFAGHVLAELRNYAPFATDGSYVVVQDTRLSNPRLRHQRYCSKPALGGPCNGPAEAVNAFLAEQLVPHVYEVDRSREYCELIGDRPALHPHPTHPRAALCPHLTHPRAALYRRSALHEPSRRIFACEPPPLSDCRIPAALGLLITQVARQL